MKKWMFLLMMGGMFWACSSDSSDPDPEPVMEQAKLTTFNYLPVAFAIDWHVNDEAYQTGQAYAFGGGSTVKWEQGKNSLKLEVLNTTDKSLVVSELESFDDGEEYIALAFGTAGDPELEVLDKDLTPPAAGKVRVRFFHALDGVGAVDIYLGGETAGFKKVSNLEYDDETDYMDVELSELTGQVVYTPTGVLPNEQTDILRYSDNQSNEADKIYTHVLAPKMNEFSKAGVFILNH
ncbi:DUF4397 domain-containing protein [Carboxylicivirga mesophila]|uniref:DUF4397 domain-containing protein n=1 Tax=Carboxylicivirga mesophila TaxID=1166478 RepID=A0ABS5KFP3_9BACT|nr:DUF4397 domain-containing protein [Carboxylicivirga mesophila]MBS2213885.1 DUF4397 domain-containing protein [Carboxylicivirga mesophila]